MNTQEKLRHALNAPGWLIVAVGVLGIVVGIRVIQGVFRLYGDTAATGTPNQIRVTFRTASWSSITNTVAVGVIIVASHP